MGEEKLSALNINLTLMGKTIFNEFNILKGIGIFLVVLGHAGSVNENIINVIFSFHMPLFFFVSGFFFKETTLKDFLVKKGKRILIPYIAFSFLSFLLYYIPNYTHSKFNLLDFFYGTFLGISDGFYLSWNIALWFLPALFFLNLIYLLLMKIKMKFLIIVLFLVGIYFRNEETEILPFHIIAVLLALPFFVFGNYLKQYYVTLNKCFKDWIFVPLLVLGIFIVCLNSFIPDLRVNLIGNPFVFYLASFILIIATLFLSRLIKENKPLQWLGDNSLLIMCLHLKFLFIAKLILLKLGFDNGFLFSLFLMPILYLPIILIKKYLPFLEGK